VTPTLVTPLIIGRQGGLTAKRIAWLGCRQSMPYFSLVSADNIGRVSAYDPSLSADNVGQQNNVKMTNDNDGPCGSALTKPAFLSPLASFSPTTERKIYE